MDLIERQAALDGINEYLEEYSGTDQNGLHNPKWCAMKEAEMLIKDLPSAQPEIIRCKDCKHFSDIYCNKHMCRTNWDSHCSFAERRES